MTNTATAATRITEEDKPMFEHNDALSGFRLGIFGKGGSGKSTVTVLLANQLQTQGYAVNLVDADSTNVGLHHALGLDRPPDPLIDYFGGMVFSGGAVTCPVDDPAPLAGANLSLNSLPENYWARTPSGVILLTLGKISDKGPGAGCDGPIAKIARDLTITTDHPSPVTLIDFKAGFEDSARGVLSRIDLALVVVDPSIAAVEMALSMKRMINDIRDGAVPATAHLDDVNQVTTANKVFSETTTRDVAVVLNRIATSSAEDIICDRLDDYGVPVLGVIEHSETISNAWMLGEPLDLLPQMDAMELVVARLESLCNAVPQPDSTHGQATRQVEMGT
ncbi:MAG: P-loop NTPase [candidate division Zixibacteria bacterium]|nr:P-loop NTPase [candidate division Zixibacteria bacterium]